jgi:spore coat protein CotF
MPFSAHETMETHEILLEKINMITHFNLYATQTSNPQLLDMLMRHQQEEILSYNYLVGLTRGSGRFVPIAPNTRVDGNKEQIEYGLRNPPQNVPSADAVMSDRDVATAMLCCHKNAARNSTWASLESADPNMRRALLNASANCNHQAYEVWRFMNDQGWYEVPTLNSQTQETFLQSYQPAPAGLQQQYGVSDGQMAVGGRPGGYGTGGINPGSPGNALYGAGTGGFAGQ